MAAAEPGQVSRVGIVGAGVIGGGWALHYLRMGFDVDVYDPAPDARARPAPHGRVDLAAAHRLGLRDGASPDRLSLPRHAWPRRSRTPTWSRRTRRRTGRSSAGRWPAIDRAARPGVVIASSTSGFAMTMLQADCEHPERCVVGHPFNPPYLIPLVEVVGGERTDPGRRGLAGPLLREHGQAAAAAEPGAARLRRQPAAGGMWREALHMVAAGEATVEEIDASIAFGPGLRWALMGPCLTFHLAGGGGGMAHMLDHFGAALLEPWTRLQAPPLTPQLRERMVDGLSGARPTAAPWPSWSGGATSSWPNCSTWSERYLDRHSGRRPATGAMAVY